MLLNRVEVAVMNNPVWRALQRFYEVAVLMRLGGTVPGGHVLEIGCGSGFGTQLILHRFGAAAVDAFDADEAMIGQAHRRLAVHGDRVRLAVGGATDLGTTLDRRGVRLRCGLRLRRGPSQRNWRSGLDEVARVLRPGGRFFFEEVTAKALARPSYKLLFDHPHQDRFAVGDCLAELDRQHLAVGEKWRALIGGDYLLGVAATAPTRITAGAAEHDGHNVPHIAGPRSAQ